MIVRRRNTDIKNIRNSTSLQQSEKLQKEENGTRNMEENCKSL